MKIKDLKKGAFFTKKPIPHPIARQVYIRGDYDRSQKKYECKKFDDISAAIYLKGDAEVYTDFVF